jgi:general secretion pathway protein E
MVTNNVPIEKIETYSYAKQHGILIVDAQEDYIKAVYRPDCSPQAIMELRRFVGLAFHPEKVSADDFNTLLTKKYEIKAVDALQVTEDMGQVDLKNILEDLPKAEDILASDNDSPVIRLINALLHEAIKQSASDIHFEPFEDKLIVRIRVDGVLRSVLEVPHLLTPLVISRLKIIANLDISEKRLPQDGRITITIANRNVNIRLSTIPVIHGERVVLRILDKEAIHLSLATLGISDQLLSAIWRMISKPHGIILVTGPTGSGKTTTLYTMLTELNSPGRNIMTVEDPIEYDLQGIAQIHVNTKIEMTFAKSLRAILRQDPNVIMVGEIRDLETAIIAVQASLTGHLVFSTLHTNTAVGTITRLRDMGVESFLLSSSLIGVIAQRLIRLLCPHCKKPYTPTPDERVSLGINFDVEQIIYQPGNCDRCNQTGYSHRIGVYEIIEMDFMLQTMIHQNASEQELEVYIRKKSLSIWQNGCYRVLSGDTSMSEIMRVTNE